MNNSKSRTHTCSPAYLLCCSWGFGFWLHWNHYLGELRGDAQLPLTVFWRNQERQAGGRTDKRSAGTGVTDGNLGSLSWCHLGAILGVAEKDWLHAAIRKVETGRARTTIEYTGDHAEGRWDYPAPNRLPRGRNSDKRRANLVIWEEHELDGAGDWIIARRGTN